MSQISLADWRGAPVPNHRPLSGRYIDLEPLNAAEHGDSLWASLSVSPDSIWDYMFYGPFSEKSSFLEWSKSIEDSKDPLFFVVIDKRNGKALGQLSLMRIDALNGVMEVGHILFSSALQRTRMATEAVFLLMQETFTNKYRRLEWKLNDANGKSHAAARRFGLAYEGTFRKHLVVKGLNRDTAWYSLVDDEWPAVGKAFEEWLEPSNFNAEGKQIKGLATRQAADIVRAQRALAS